MVEKITADKAHCFRESAVVVAVDVAVEATAAAAADLYRIIG